MTRLTSRVEKLEQKMPTPPQPDSWPQSLEEWRADYEAGVSIDEQERRYVHANPTQKEKIETWYKDLRERLAELEAMPD